MLETQGERGWQGCKSESEPESSQEMEPLTAFRGNDRQLDLRGSRPLMGETILLYNMCAHHI